jgi:hypothetical protein
LSFQPRTFSDLHCQFIRPFLAFGGSDVSFSNQARGSGYIGLEIVSKKLAPDTNSGEIDA